MTTETQASSTVADDLQQLRKAILGDDIHLLEEASNLIKDEEAFSARMANGLNDALIASDAASNKLSFGLRDPMLKSLAIAAQTKPEELSKSLAPIIGKAVISAVTDAMRGMNEQIEMIYTKSFTLKGLKWRIESWRTGEPYTRIAMKNTHSFQIQQIAFLSKRHGKILANTYGKMVLERREDRLDKQQDLLETLSRNMQVTKLAHEIKPVEANAQQIYVAHKPWSSLAVVCWGDAPKDLTSRMLDLLNHLEKDYALDLKKFKDDKAPFESVTPQLNNLLNSIMVDPRKPKDHTPKKSLSTMTWFSIIGLLLLIWFSYLFLNYLQSDALKKQLQLQPGFVFSSMEGNIFQGWEVFGLVDPLGFNAQEVVKNSDVNAEKIKFNLMPYVSLVPSIVLKRANAKLSPPDTVKLMLGEQPSELIVSGVADQAWIDQLSAKQLALIGIEKINSLRLQAGKVEAPAPMPDPKSLQYEIDMMRIEFIEKDRYAEGQEAKLDKLAEQIISLDKMAKALQKTLIIHVTGHASPDGNSQQNQQLQVDRAKAVIVSLLQRGINQSQFVIANAETTLETRLVTFKANLN